MSVPQTKDRPASALRAVFAGIGSLLSVKDKLSGKDKVRSKPAAEAPADAVAPEPQAAAPEQTAETETVAVETIAEPEPAAAEAATAAAAAPEKTAEPEAVVAETTAGGEASAPAKADSGAAPKAAPKAAGELPLANYDELTVASLRARLRNLSNDDLVQLKEYEAAHQNRPEVIKMFQNRLIKMTSSMPKLEA